MQAKLNLIKSVLSDKKATDIDTFDFRNGFFIHAYMILTSVNNPRLLAACADYLCDALEAANFPIHHREGTAESGWILIDTSEVLIHLFLDETRAFYQLDRLWADKKVERYVDSVR